MTVQHFMGNIKIEQSTDCWVWRLSKDRNGYGKLHITRPDGRRTVVVPHRWLYEQVIGRVQTGFELDHAACQRRECVNPAHLEQVTHLENMRRSDRLGRRPQISCQRGHSLRDAYKNNQAGTRRTCRHCALFRKAKYKLAKKNKSNG